MHGNAFVYGTLMADEVLRVLIRRVPKSKPATLRGFERRSLQGQVYPAAIPSSTPEAVLKGKVLLELEPEELRVLDVYEAAEYERVTVRPTFEDNTDVEADVYIFRDEYKSLLQSTPWDYEEWRRQHLHRWLSKCETGNGMMFDWMPPTPVPFACGFMPSSPGGC